MQVALASPERRRQHLLAANRASEWAVDLEPAAAAHHLQRTRILTRMVRTEPPLADRDAALAAIDRAVALEPAFRPVLRAALELSLQLGDTARAESIDALRRGVYGE